MRGILVLFCGLASCQMLVKADTDDELCVFPFVYKGVTYYTCTTVENGGDYWCAFTSTFQYNRWKDCKGATEAESSVYIMLGVRNRLIKHQTGTIISHRGYPQQSYSSSVNSTLRIRVNGVLSVTLNILDFVLENTSSNGSCYDYLQLNEDVRYCQNHLSSGQKKTFISANGKFRLSFYTDSSDVNRGFRIQYSYFTIEPSSCETDRLQNAYQYIKPAANSDDNVNAVSAECKIGSPTIIDTLYCDSSSNTWNVVNSGVANSLCFNIIGALAVHNPQDNPQKVTDNKKGYVISHANFPEDYTANIDSSLTITGLKPRQIVQVKFLVFDLYSDPKYRGCLYDYLQITGVGTLCSDPGRRPALDRWHTVNFFSSELTFRFRTNEYHSTVKSGFYFAYKVLEPVPVTTTTHITSSTVGTEPSTFTPTTVTIVTQTAAGISSTHTPVPEISTASISSTDAITSTETMPPSWSTDTKSNIPAENPTDTDTQLRGQDNSVALGAGIGVSALIILIVIVIVVLVLLRRRREQAKSKPDDGDSGPTYGYTNQSAEDTLQIRMSALPADSENYYSMSDAAGLNSNPASNHSAATSQDGTRTSAGETVYDMAEQVDTGGIYHLADDAGTDNSEYTLAEEVTPNRTAQAQNQVTGYEDEYQLADSNAEDYANIESIHRAEDERTLEEDYSSVLVTTKAKKTNNDAGVTELVDNELYGS